MQCPKSILFRGGLNASCAISVPARRGWNHTRSALLLILLPTCVFNRQIVDQPEPEDFVGGEGDVDPLAINSVAFNVSVGRGDSQVRRVLPALVQDTFHVIMCCVVVPKHALLTPHSCAGVQQLSVFSPWEESLRRA